MRLEFTSKAQIDFEDCVIWSAETFGLQAARRYQKLIFTALEEIQLMGDPQNSGIRSGIFPKFRFYHLRHSRKKAIIDGLIVKRPRHLIVYRQEGDDLIFIVRILHDSMDLRSHLEGEN